MKNTQKKKISRSYHLLTKVESRKCRRVTAAIDVIVTLCRKSVGKQVCNVLRTVRDVTRKTVFRQQMVTSSYFLFLYIFHLPFSFNSTSTYFGWSLNAQQGLKRHLPRYQRPYCQKRRVSPKQQDNDKEGNFERFVQGQYTVTEKCFSRNVVYIPPISEWSDQSAA